VSEAEPRGHGRPDAGRPARECGRDARTGTVLALRRYPVKSLGGERLDELDVEPRGVVGDRLWALVDRDGKLASGKGSRRFRAVRGLMLHAARLDAGEPVVTLADGRTAPAADEPAMAGLVEAMAGPGWRLAREAAVPHHDAAPVHLATTSTLATLTQAVGHPVDVERLRPNVLVDTGEDPGFAEDAWVGRELQIGDVRLRVRDRTERCVMVDHPRAGMPPFPGSRGVLKAAGRLNAACAGVYADVLVGGRIRAGDPVALA
jgi:uncharacterized protein